MDKPSKSERKRQQLALQALGEKLIRLSRPELESMHLPDTLSDAVVNAKGMRAHGALRRQRRLIGKLMRQVDAAEIATAVDALETRTRLDKQAFHAIEHWRDRLCSGGAAALAEFAGLTGRRNSRLESLLQMLDDAENDAESRAVRRRIFREIHDDVAETAGQSREPDPGSTQ